VKFLGGEGRERNMDKLEIDAALRELQARPENKYVWVVVVTDIV